jgi:glucose/arabinose dehydrogenase
VSLNTSFGLLILLAALLPLSAQAQSQIAVPDNTKYQWVQITSGFNNPLFIANAGDGSGRLFVVEQDGYIFILQNGVYDDADPFLDISDLLSSDVFQGGYTERGLLGLAFHPDFKTNGLFFINHTDRNGDTIVARYRVDPADPNHADPASRVELLKIHQLFYDHNGGDMAFGPDGYLYIGVGDGGSQGDDPGSTGQNMSTLLGKMLRIDVKADTYAVPPDNPFVGKADVLPEIWAYGLRNPWRFSFDRATGDLYIGDVGQASYEEIDYQPAGDPGGENYGWYDFEAMHPYKSETPPPNMTMPIAEYPHIVGCAVTGGYVYRGPSLPELQGIYFFGDYCTGRTWSLFRNAAGNWKVQPFTPSEKVISSFGEDEQGELYMVDYKGEILRLESAD